VAKARVLHMMTRPVLGGAQMNTLDLARRLPADRYEVEVLTGPDVGAEPSLQSAFTDAGIPVHLLPGLHREESATRDLAALWRTVGFLRRGRYDVLHTHMAKAGVIGRMAAGFAKVPVVVHTVHGWPWHNFVDRKTKERYVGYERRAAARTDRLIVVSERDRGKGLAQGVAPPDRFTLIRSGIDFDVFDPAKYEKAACRKALDLPEDAPVMVTVGALTEQKNPLEALEVTARVKNAFPAVRHLIVGDGPLKDDVDARIAALDLEGNVRRLGARDDVPAILAAADVFLLTSRWEGLPRTLIEAMAMGKAVVATQVDGVLDVIEDNVTGYARDPGDVDELSAMCVRLFRAPNLITEMFKGNTAFLRRPEFRADTTAAQVDALYRELLAAKGRM